MKRTLAFILCMVMLVSMAALGVSAAASYSDKEPTDVGTLVVKKGASKKDITESNGSVVNLADTAHPSARRLTAGSVTSSTLKRLVLTHS